LTNTRNIATKEGADEKQTKKANVGRNNGLHFSNKHQVSTRTQRKKKERKREKKGRGTLKLQGGDN